MLITNTVWLTIIAIVLLTLVLMVINRRNRDRCLKDFDGFATTYFDVIGKRVWGRLIVYSTGLEFKYWSEHLDEEGHIETSWILYKKEFGSLLMLVRFNDELTERNKTRRLKQIEKSFHPKFYRRWGRSIRNLLVNLRDAFTDITSAVISAVGTGNAAARVLSTQQKQMNKVQGELSGYAGTAYDPILEKHIGSQVVLEITEPSKKVVERTGILKEYSAEFLEIMGVRFQDGETVRDCDIIVPRTISFIRHSNEPVKTGDRRVKEN